MEAGDGVGVDAVAAARVAAHDGHVDRARRRRAEARQHPGGRSAQQRIWLVREHRRHRPRPRPLECADEVHAAVEPPQPPTRDAVGDRMPAEAGRMELRSGRHAVLPRGERDHLPIGALNRHFSRPQPSRRRPPGEMPLLPAQVPVTSQRPRAPGEMPSPFQHPPPPAAVRPRAAQTWHRFRTARAETRSVPTPPRSPPRVRAPRRSAPAPAARAGAAGRARGGPGGARSRPGACRAASGV